MMEFHCTRCRPTRADPVSAVSIRHRVARCATCGGPFGRVAWKAPPPRVVKHRSASNSPLSIPHDHEAYLVSAKRGGHRVIAHGLTRNHALTDAVKRLGIGADDVHMTKIR